MEEAGEEALEDSQRTAEGTRRRAAATGAGRVSSDVRGACRKRRDVGMQRVGEARAHKRATQRRQDGGAVGMAGQRLGRRRVDVWVDVWVDVLGRRLRLTRCSPAPHAHSRAALAPPHPPSSASGARPQPANRPQPSSSLSLALCVALRLPRLVYPPSSNASPQSAVSFQNGIPSPPI